MKVQLVLKDSSAMKSINISDEFLMQLIKGIREKGEEIVTTTVDSYTVTGVLVTSESLKAEAILMK